MPSSEQFRLATWYSNETTRKAEEMGKLRHEYSEHGYIQLNRRISNSLQVPDVDFTESATSVPAAPETVPLRTVARMTVAPENAAIKSATTKSAAPKTVASKTGALKATAPIATPIAVPKKKVIPAKSSRLAKAVPSVKTVAPAQDTAAVNPASNRLLCPAQNPQRHPRCHLFQSHKVPSSTRTSNPKVPTEKVS